VVVFGGRHADVALDPGMGTPLSLLVGTRPLACVVDISDLGSAAARGGDGVGVDQAEAPLASFTQIAEAPAVRLEHGVVARIASVASEP